MADRDLYALVGVSPQATAADLRHAYEAAMRQATRSGDHQHALRLSAAFDALPAARRSSVYPDSRGLAGSARQLPPAPGGWVDVAEPRPARRRAGRRGRRVRMVVYGLALVAAVGGLAWLQAKPRTGAGDHVRPRPVFVDQGTSDESAPPEQSPSTPEPSYGPTLVVPADAPTGAGGFVTVVCHPPSGAPGYLMTVPRGTAVTCANGALPQVIR